MQEGEEGLGKGASPPPRDAISLLVAGRNAEQQQKKEGAPVMHHVGGVWCMHEAFELGCTMGLMRFLPLLFSAQGGSFGQYMALKNKKLQEQVACGPWVLAAGSTGI